MIIYNCILHQRIFIYNGQLHCQLKGDNYCLICWRTKSLIYGKVEEKTFSGREIFFLLLIIMIYSTSVIGIHSSWLRTNKSTHPASRHSSFSQVMMSPFRKIYEVVGVGQWIKMKDPYWASMWTFIVVFPTHDSPTGDCWWACITWSNLF